LQPRRFGRDVPREAGQRAADLIDTRVQFEPGLDIYHLFNSNVVLVRNQNYRATLGEPQRILQGRLLQFTA